MLEQKNVAELKKLAAELGAAPADTDKPGVWRAHATKEELIAEILRVSPGADQAPATAPATPATAPAATPAPAPAAVDPFGIMAQSIIPHFIPTLDRRVSGVMEAVRKIESDLVGRIGAVESRPIPTLDLTAVRGEVTKALQNGGAEQIRALVEPHVGGALLRVVEKAADAVVAAGPEPEEEIGGLRAGVEPGIDPLYVWDATLEKVADLLLSASEASPQNALIVGPSGCGKTEFAAQLAARGKRDLFIMDCGNVRESRDWFGAKGAASGSTFFRLSQFWHAVETEGCVVLLDEVNRVPDTVKSQLLPLLDHRRCTWCDEAGAFLRVGKGVIFLATANEGLEYTGTFAMDRALVNRFPRRIEVGFLPMESEIDLLVGKISGLKKSDAKKLVECAGEVRNKAAAEMGGLDCSISTRQLLAAASDFVAVGPESLRWTLLSQYSAEGGVSSQRRVVAQIFEGKGLL